MRPIHSLYLAAFSTLVIFGVSICSNNSPDIPVAAYPEKIEGQWRGTVGDLKENMIINSDCTFICQLHPTGFIADMLAQGVEGTVNGTWKISGKVILLNITGEKNENLINHQSSSTIESFKEDEIILMSDKGETSTFHRQASF